MSKQRESQIIRVELGRPAVVVLSQPNETRWGYYQFPEIFRLDNGHLAVLYSVHSDSAMSYGQPKPGRVSSDGGKTWHAAAAGMIEQSSAEAIVFPDGEAIKFPMQKPLDASSLKLPKRHILHTDLYGRKSECYRLGDLPDDLQYVKMLRRAPGKAEWGEEWARLDIPNCVVSVFRWEWSAAGWSDPNILVQPRINPTFFWTIASDSEVLVFSDYYCFNADGTIPERMGSAVLRSDDRGRTWRVWGVPGYFPDAAAERAAAQPFLDDPNSNYNRLWGSKENTPIPNFVSGGLYEPGVVSFGDGRMICIMRTSTGGTHEPMFISRSSDWGKIWTIPEIITPFGVMPKIVRLDNGVITLVYGRPGVQLLFCTDGNGEIWHTPINLLPELGEKTRASIGCRGTITTNNQAGHDDTCGNCTVLKTGSDRFLVAYSDFRYVDAAGQTCKAIKVQELTVAPASKGPTTLAGDEKQQEINKVIGEGAPSPFPIQLQICNYE